MKAIRVHQFGEPDVLRLEETAAPVAAGGQVLVRVRAAGVNPVETYIRAGWYGKKDFPYTPGNDSGGVIEAVGSGVDRFERGDRVYTAATITGSYAELALCDAAKVHPLPEHVSFEQGAAVGVPYGTAYRGLFQRAKAIPGETVLVHGASGGVGIAATQLASAAGMSVIGTAGTDEGLKLVKDQGARHALNHHDAGYTDRIMELTGGRGVDVILEMLANVNLAKDLTLLAKFGRVVVIGSRGKIEIDPRETMSRDAEIRGMGGANASEAEQRSIHAAIVAGLEKRTLNPIVGRRFPLADAAAAHVAVMEGGHMGKIVLIP